MIKWINKKRNKKGFTLIELIVVIAILGILAALAIPRLTGSRDNAQRKAILANLRTIDSAIALYQAEGTGDLPATIDALKPNYIAEVPNSVKGEEYGLLEEKVPTTEDPDATRSLGRATVTFKEETLNAAADTYTVEELLKIKAWGNKE